MISFFENDELHRANEELHRTFEADFRTNEAIKLAEKVLKLTNEHNKFKKNSIKRSGGMLYKQIIVK